MYLEFTVYASIRSNAQSRYLKIEQGVLHKHMTWHSYSTSDRLGATSSNFE